MLEMMEIEEEQVVFQQDPQESENPGRPQEGPDSVSIRSSLCKVLVFSGLAGTVGSILTFMCLALPLGGGDFLTALCIWPLVLVLVAVVNGWMAANLFVGSGLPK